MLAKYKSLKFGMCTFSGVLEFAEVGEHLILGETNMNALPSQRDGKTESKSCQ
jgi:hypothetical protein